MRISDWSSDVCSSDLLTSGGTVANYQALRLALALKAFPVALRAAGVPDIGVPGDDWTAFNLGPDAGIALLERANAWLAAQPAREQRRWVRAVQRPRLEFLGMVDFFEIGSASCRERVCQYG